MRGRPGWGPWPPSPGLLRGGPSLSGRLPQGRDLPQHPGGEGPAEGHLPPQGAAKQRECPSGSHLGGACWLTPVAPPHLPPHRTWAVERACLPSESHRLRCISCVNLRRKLEAASLPVCKDPAGTSALVVLLRAPPLPPSPHPPWRPPSLARRLSLPPCALTGPPITLKASHCPVGQSHLGWRFPRQEWPFTWSCPPWVWAGCLGAPVSDSGSPLNTWWTLTSSPGPQPCPQGPDITLPTAVFSFFLFFPSFSLVYLMLEPTLGPAGACVP